MFEPFVVHLTGGGQNAIREELSDTEMIITWSKERDRTKSAIMEKHNEEEEEQAETRRRRRRKKKKERKKERKKKKKKKKSHLPST